MKVFSKRRVAAAALLILLGLFLVRPGVSRLKTKIANAISRGVARPVEVGSVHLRFLPPGFDLKNLVIYEDPAFGPEPMLSAAEVTAVVRLTSLLRGRLDIARMELNEPSLNLVRRSDGRWNWEALLERTARTPLAPTAKSKSEARPGFPYIEASSGRINFKAGPEKKPYALLNADFSLWQESENTWGMRLQAEPRRTDMSLSDAGQLRMNGTWRRAGSLRETPLQFSLEWERTQLGQLTKLVSGNDKGWRGEAGLDATLSGSPAALKVAVTTSIRDFHRYDIPSSEGLRLAAHCDGTYSSAENVLREILCSAPVGNGRVTMRGDAGLPGMRRVNLFFNAENVPASAVLQLARRAKKSLPADLVAAGSVQGNFTIMEDGTSRPGPKVDGRGEITNFRLRSETTKVEFATESIPIVVSAGAASHFAASKSVSLHNLNAESLPAPNDLQIAYGPFPVALGRAVAAQARGWMARSGYGMVIRGDAEVSHTLRLASLLGLPAVQVNAEGGAQMDLQIAGSWAENVPTDSSGFSLPEVTGTVQVHNVRLAMRGINAPIEVSSAELELLPNEVRVEKLSARAADAHWIGSMALPRGCGTPGACVVHFNLNTEEVGLSELSRWLNPQPSKRPWYQMLSAVAAAPSFLASLRGSGRVAARRVRIHTIVAEQLSASLDLEHGKLKISELRFDLLGGTHRGNWHADFSAGPPVYAGTGTLTGISLKQIADAMGDPWISGTATGTYQLSASGTTSAAFWQSAEGGLQFDLSDGIFSHISLASDQDPLRIARWQGEVQLQGGKLEIEKGTLTSSMGTYEIGGTASFARELDVTLTRDSEVKSAGPGSLIYSITGTLAEPHIALTPAPETQARLKP